MCIYYKDCPSLNYTSGEHIFPAAIGGMQKLPVDYVSDQFNNDISKLEQDFFRLSLVSFARITAGPGKRGSLSGKNMTKSVVHILEDTSTGKHESLGYIKMGRSVEIPHVGINLSTGHMWASFDRDAYESGDINLTNFSNSFKDPQKLRVRSIINENLEPDIVLFGIAEGVEENYNAFYARHPCQTRESSDAFVRMVGEALKAITLQAPTVQKYMPRSILNMKFSPDHLRVYAKVAFNYLAYLKGEAFVKQEFFDLIRNWIAKGGTNSSVSLNAGKDVFKDILLPKDHLAHSVIIFKSENILAATVTLYGSMSAIVRLSDNFNAPFPTEGLFCIWKEKRELRLAEFVAESLVESRGQEKSKL